MEALAGISIIYLIIPVALLALSIGMAIIVSNIAADKGYSAVGFYFFAVVLFFPALIVALFLPNKTKKEEKTNAELLLLYKHLYDEGIIGEREYLDRKKELLEDLRG